MNPKTKQEVFNQVATHLLDQNCRAEVLGDCRYRGADGTRCAVGCLIPDSVYRPELEGHTIGAEAVLWVLSSIGLTPHINLLVKLQYLHDVALPETWRDRLTKLAEEEGLSMVPV